MNVLDKYVASASQRRRHKPYRIFGDQSSTIARDAYRSDNGDEYLSWALIG